MSKFKNPIQVESDGKKFPTSSIDQSALTKTNTHTPCPWKGEASYYTITVDGIESTLHPCKKLIIPLQDKRQRIRPGIIQSRWRRLSISRTMSHSVYTRFSLGVSIFAQKPADLKADKSKVEIKVDQQGVNT